MALVILFDPADTPVSYGYYRCQECKAAFFGGGDALHEKTCSREGYEGLQYVLNPEAARVVLSGKGNQNPIDADQLRLAIPNIDELLRAEVAA